VWVAPAHGLAKLVYGWEEGLCSWSDRVRAGRLGTSSSAGRRHGSLGAPRMRVGARTSSHWCELTCGTESVCGLAGFGRKASSSCYHVTAFNVC